MAKKIIRCDQGKCVRIKAASSEASLRRRGETAKGIVKPANIYVAQ